MSKASAAFTSPRGGISGGGIRRKYTVCQSIEAKKGCSFTSLGLQCSERQVSGNEGFRALNLVFPSPQRRGSRLLAAKQLRSRSSRVSSGFFLGYPDQFYFHNYNFVQNFFEKGLKFCSTFLGIWRRPLSLFYLFLCPIRLDNTISWFINQLSVASLLDFLKGWKRLQKSGAENWGNDSATNESKRNRVRIVL